MQKKILNTMLKISLENSLPLPRNRQKYDSRSYDVNNHLYLNSKFIYFVLHTDIDFDF